VSSSGKGDAEKARYWLRTISEAARSGMSMRAFYCRWRLRESQFYWWQRRLKAGRVGRGLLQQNLANWLAGERAWLRLPSTRACGLLACNASRLSAPVE
jgi:hypothetical protein